MIKGSKTISQSQRDKISKTLTGKLNSGRSKIVFQIDLITCEIIKQYPSASEAKRQTGINGILNVLSGRAETAGGYKWRY